MKEKHEFVPKTCWIADVKEKVGLRPSKAWNREGEQRKFPCPEEKVEAITAAFRHFGMI